MQVEAVSAEILELQQKLAELKVKEKAMIEGEHKIESLQHELASIEEKLNEKEVNESKRLSTANLSTSLRDESVHTRGAFIECMEELLSGKEKVSLKEISEVSL